MTSKEILEEFAKDAEKFDNSVEGWSLDLRLDLTEIIFNRLQQLGWTPSKLAKIAGINRSLLSRIMHGNQNCTFETTAKILFALGVKSHLTKS